MQKQSKKFYLLAVMAVLAFTVVACTPKAKQAVTDTLTDQDEVVVRDEVTVVLNTQNNSGQSGTAVLKRQGESTVVTVQVDNFTTGVAQPAHIHLNNCANIGGVKYPLSLVFNGQSETVVPAVLDSLLNQEQLSINVHKSAEEVGVYVACGDLPFEAKAMDDTSAMEDNGDDPAMVDDNNMEAEDDKDDNTADVSEARTINLDAFNFGYSASEIKVKKGEKVKLVLSSTGGFHDWVVDEFSAKTSRINSGETTSVEFTADKAGSFEFYCSVGSHRALGMVGKLIVE